MITIYFLIAGFFAGWTSAATHHGHIKNSFGGYIVTLAGCAVWPLSLLVLLALVFVQKGDK